MGVSVVFNHYDQEITMYGNKLGEMAWMDLSVPDANHIKDFYQQVLGWQSEAIAMTAQDEKYNDFVMSTPSNKEQIANAGDGDSSAGFATGICHAKGTNANIPATWLPYFLVADIEHAAIKVKEHGGKLVTEIKSMGADQYVIIEDPAGAHCALYHKGDKI